MLTIDIEVFKYINKDIINYMLSIDLDSREPYFYENNKYRFYLNELEKSVGRKNMIEEIKRANYEIEFVKICKLAEINYKEYL